MELTTLTSPAKVEHTLTLVRTIAAGEKLKSEVGEDELDTQVPAGKQWRVWTEIYVIETDA